MAKPRGSDPLPGDDAAGSPTGDLAQRIARAQASRATGPSRANRYTAGDATTMGRGIRLGSEFIAAVLVGLGVGYLLDQWLHTTPWLMLVMLLVGFAAGVLNVVRAAAEMNRAAPVPPMSAPLPDDDEEDE